MPVASSAGHDNADRADVPGDTVSPSLNVQLPPAAVAPSTSMADNAATIASLRMVCLMAGLAHMFPPLCLCAHIRC